MIGIESGDDFGSSGDHVGEFADEFEEADSLLLQIIWSQFEIARNAPLGSTAGLEAIATAHRAVNLVGITHIKAAFIDGKSPQNSAVDERLWYQRILDFMANCFTRSLEPPSLGAAILPETATPMSLVCSLTSDALGGMTRGRVDNDVFRIEPNKRPKLGDSELVIRAGAVSAAYSLGGGVYNDAWRAELTALGWSDSTLRTWDNELKRVGGMFSELASHRICEACATDKLKKMKQ